MYEQIQGEVLFMMFYAVVAAMAMIASCELLAIGLRHELPVPEVHPR